MNWSRAAQQKLVATRGCEPVRDPPPAEASFAPRRRSANQKSRAGLVTKFRSLPPNERERAKAEYKERLRKICANEREVRGFWSLQFAPLLKGSGARRPTKSEPMPSERSDRATTQARQKTQRPDSDAGRLPEQSGPARRFSRDEILEAMRRSIAGDRAAGATRAMPTRRAKPVTSVRKARGKSVGRGPGRGAKKSPPAGGRSSSLVGLTVEPSTPGLRIAASRRGDGVEVSWFPELGLSRVRIDVLDSTGRRLRRASLDAAAGLARLGKLGAADPDIEVVVRGVNATGGVVGEGRSRLTAG